MGRVRTKTVKKSAKVIIERYGTPPRRAIRNRGAGGLTGMQILPKAQPRLRGQQEDL
jgi:ribosomal protein S17E